MVSHKRECYLAYSDRTTPLLCSNGPFSPCPLHFFKYTAFHIISFLEGALGHLLFSLCLILLPVDKFVIYLFKCGFLDPSLYLFPFLNVAGVRFFERCSPLLILSSLFCKNYFLSYINVTSYFQLFLGYIFNYKKLWNSLSPFKDDKIENLMGCPWPSC